MSSEKWTARDPKADAVRGDQGLILDSESSDNNKRMFLEDFSRLQSAIHDYSNLFKYKVDDKTNFNETIYKNITPVTNPLGEEFDPVKWEAVGGRPPSLVVRVESDLPTALEAPFTEIFDDGDGKASFTTTTPHGYKNGQTVEIIGTGNTNYDNKGGVIEVNPLFPAMFKIPTLNFDTDLPGTAIRCWAIDEAYTNATLINNFLGYRLFPGSNNILQSQKDFGDVILLLGNNTTMFKCSSLASLEFRNIIIVDLGTGNKLFDIEGTGGITVVVQENTITDGFGEIGTINNTTYVNRGNGITNFTKGLVGKNLGVGILGGVATSTNPSAIFIKLNNTAVGAPPVVILGLGPTMPAGASVLDINPATDVTNSNVVANCGATGGADYFKPNSNASFPINGYAAGATDKVLVETTGHNLQVGDTVFISDSINYNREYIVEAPLTLGLNFTIPFPGTFPGNDATPGKWTQVKPITIIVDSGPTISGTWGPSLTNNKGGTTIFASDIGTLLEDGRLVNITASPIDDYNGVHRIFNVVNGVSFDIPVPENGDTTGNWEEESVSVSSLRHGLSNGTPVLIDKTINYDIGGKIFNKTDDSFSFPAVYTVDESAGVILDGSLNQKAKNVLLSTVGGELNSKAKGSILIIGNNAVDIDLSTINQYADMNFGVFAIEAADTELWRVTDAAKGELQYRGLEPFSGTLIAVLDITNPAGSNGSFRNTFRVLKNGGRMIDGAEFQSAVEATPLVTQGTVSVSISAITDDKFRLQVKRILDSPSNTNLRVLSGSIVIQ